jgi:leucyl aminopeptidase
MGGFLPEILVAVIGANCYLVDEIITSRTGERIRVGNIDAEGRMAMVDWLMFSAAMLRS